MSTFYYKILYISIIFFLVLKPSWAVIPAPNKVVVLILENHAYQQIVGSPAAPYINSLINDSKCALFSNSYALTSPSQPCYLQLFSGSNQGVTNNNVPALFPFVTANLGAELLAASKTFIGYSESLPSVGYTGAASGSYVRKHNPWVNWQGIAANGIPASSNQPFTAFPTNYNLLPHVSFVIPNLLNDMHDGTDPSRISIGDNWVQSNLGNYIQWAKTNNSLLILTFDEDDYMSQLHVLTLFIGEKVQHGIYPNIINHYNVLRVIEDMFSLPHAGAASVAATIDYCWTVCSQPAIISASGPLTFCQGNSVTLTASNGISFLWSNGATTQSIAASTQADYSVSITDGINCTAFSAPASVIVNSFVTKPQVFKETIGTVSVNTPISTYETNNGFDNDNLTMSGTGEVSSASNSLDSYPGASSTGNIFLTNSVGRNIVISNINTSGLSGLELSFGAFKNTAASTGSDLLVQVSSDGVSYTTLSFPPLPLGISIWNYRTASGNIPSVPNLRIKFIQNGTSTQYRIDDILLTYSISSPLITAEGSTTFCQGNSVSLNATFANAYSWSNGQTAQNISAGTSGNYFVTQSSPAGCTAVSNTISIVVNPNVVPSVSISASPGNTICSGTNVLFTAMPVNGGASPIYQWTKNGSAAGINSPTYSNPSLLNGDVIACVMTSSANCPTLNPANSNLIIMNIAEIFSINNFNPLSAPVGSSVIINGNNFNSVTSVTFNGISTSYNLINNTQLSVVVPAGAASGIISVSNFCMSVNSSSSFILIPGNPVINLKLFIEGYYIGGGFMNSILNPGICDTVTIRLHEDFSPYNILYSAKSVISTSGNGVFNLDGSVFGKPLFIEAFNHNCLSTWSSSAITFEMNTSYDFSNDISKAFGNNMKSLGDGNYAFYSGDVTNNGQIDLGDISIMQNKVQLFLAGYLKYDLNGDKLVESTDFSLIENNIPVISVRP